MRRSPLRGSVGFDWHYGDDDAVALARGMLYDPRWPWHAAAALGDHAPAPPQYLRCAPHGLASTLRSTAPAAP